MYDAMTKEFIGEVQAPNQPENSTELPPVRILKGETYHLTNPKFNGTNWVGDNKELDLLDTIKLLSLQVGENSAKIEALMGGEKENV